MASVAQRSARCPAVIVAAALAVGAANYGYSRYLHRAHRSALENSPALPFDREAVSDPSTGFRCDGRTHCSQMTSCAEATWFIHHCPGTRMDGNHDGVRCVPQWCSHRFAK